MMMVHEGVNMIEVGRVVQGAVVGVCVKFIRDGGLSRAVRAGGEGGCGGQTRWLSRLGPRPGTQVEGCAGYGLLWRRRREPRLRSHFFHKNAPEGAGAKWDSFFLLSPIRKVVLCPSSVPRGETYGQPLFLSGL